MEVDIAIVVSPRDWAERVHRFAADHGGARVRARVLDAREALEADYDVLVAEDLTSFLTPRLIDELHRRGRRVLGVHDPAEPWGAERLAELGVDDQVRSDADPEEFLRAVQSLAAVLDLDQELSALVEAPTVDTVTPARGLVVAVGGPSGGPGATEVAIGLARGLVDRGEVVALVDADDVAPAVAQRLGLPLHPNIRSAIDRIEHRTGPVTETLQDVQGTGVLVGLTSPHDWHAVRPFEVSGAIDELAARHDAVVLDIGHGLDDLAVTTGHGRHAMSRTALSAADLLVAVALPTPVGVARLVGWASEAATVAPEAVLHVVVNRAGSGPFVRREVEAEIRRVLEPASVVFLPVDARVERASWDGGPPAEGPFTRAIAAWLDDHVPPVVAAVP